MPKNLKSGKKAGMMIAMIITIITIGLATAAPLDIVIEEKVNTTATPSSDGTGAITFSYTTNVTGYVNITNKANEAIYDIWIAVNLVNNTGDCRLFYNGSSSVVSVGPSLTIPDKINKAGVLNTTGADCFIHIPLLKPNELVSIFYDVDDNVMGINNGAPFVVNESYNPAKIPARGEYSWTVYLNASLNQTWFGKTAVSLTGNNVSLNITKYLSNQTAHFGSNQWVLLGPISNVNSNKGSTNLWNGPYTTGNNDALNVTGITLNTTSPNVNITFSVTGNYSNSTAAPYYFEPFGFAVFSFNLTYGNISGTQVVDVFAIGNASLNVTKYGPNATNYWFGNASVTNIASGLTYILTNVTMWATPQNNYASVIQNSYQEWTPSVLLQPNGNWNTSSATPAGISFQYNQVPIIWANATFKLIRSTSQGWFANSTTLNDFNATYGSNFIVIEKIYIIGTYLVKVTKHVLYNSTASSGTTNVFDIYLVVENLGGEVSPYVYVYDLIPSNFAEYDWDDKWDDIWSTNYVNKSSMLAGNGSVNNPMSGYVRGHYWRLMPIASNADGNGSYEDWNEIEANKTVVIFYQLAGTGDFKVLDAFIVGIDPMFSLNEQTSPKITLVSGAKATSYETTLAVIAFASFGILAFVGRRNGQK